MQLTELNTTAAHRPFLPNVAEKARTLRLSGTAELDIRDRKRHHQ